MQKGFTLLELLVVIAIIGILSSIVLVSYNGYTAKARLAKTLSWAGSVNHSLGDRAVGAWTFDNIIGTTVYDDSGNNNNGTAYGGPLVVDGVVGKAMQFDGVDDYATAPHNNSLNPTSVTISTWVYPITYGYYPYVVSKYNHYILRFYSTTGRVENYTYIDGAWRACTTPTNIIAPLNQWSYLVHTYNGSQGRIYINGVLGCTFNYSGAINTSGTDILRIGSYYTTTVSANYRFNGLIDDIRIFSAALSQAQVQQHYADGLKTHQNLAKK